MYTCSYIYIYTPNHPSHTILTTPWAPPKQDHDLGDGLLG